MPLASDYYQEEDEFDPAPRVPPITGGGGGGTAPAGGGGGGGQAPPLLDLSGFNPGGGWSGGGGPIPAYPRINIPGAPQFQPTPYRAPTFQDALNEPGYQFRVDQGQRGLERSAAAQGRLRTGGTLTDLTEYNQKFAANEYNNVAQRAMAAWDRNYRAESDAFAPRLQAWQLRAGGEREAQLDRYRAEIAQHMRDSAPRYNPGVDLFELLGPEPTMPGGEGGPMPFEGGRNWDDPEMYY